MDQYRNRKHNNIHNNVYEDGEYIEIVDDEPVKSGKDTTSNTRPYQSLQKGHHMRSGSDDNNDRNTKGVSKSPGGFYDKRNRKPASEEKTTNCCLKPISVAVIVTLLILSLIALIILISGK